jgi:hypothetical protein
LLAGLGRVGLFTASRWVKMYYGEKLNAWTHLVGAVLAVAGSAVLVVLAARDGDPWKVVSVSIYGATLVLLYCFSTLYHSFRGRAKDILRKLDHQSIYLLIAGSYTPFCLVTLRGPWGWSLLAVVWGLAVVGGLQELWLQQRGADSVGGDLRGHGLGGGGGAGSLAAGPGDGGIHLACGGRRAVHHGDHLLCSRHAAATRARCLAPVRPGGECRALFRDPVLRALMLIRRKRRT